MRFKKFLNEKALFVDQSLVKEIQGTIEKGIKRAQGKKFRGYIMSLNLATKKYDIIWEEALHTKDDIDPSIHFVKAGTDRSGIIFVYIDKSIENEIDPGFYKTFTNKIMPYIQHELVHREQGKSRGPDFDFDKLSSDAARKKVLDMTGDKIAAQFAYLRHDSELMGWTQHIIVTLRRWMSREEVDDMLRKGQFKKGHKDVKEIMLALMDMRNMKKADKKYKRFLRYAYEINNNL